MGEEVLSVHLPWLIRYGHCHIEVPNEVPSHMKCYSSGDEFILYGLHVLRHIMFDDI